MLASEKSISVSTTPAGSKPSSSPPAFSAPRKKSPALKIRTSDRVICAMTSTCLGAKKRVRRLAAVDSAPWFFRSADNVRPRGLQRRTETENQRRDDAESDGGGQDYRVGPEIGRQREVHGSEQG